MKVGGLRLWLFLNMMGQLNTPDHKTWKANQVTDDYENKNILEMFYKDTTGAIIVHFSEADNDSDPGTMDGQNKTNTKINAISIYRFGTTPSMNYMMQESHVLLGILNELDKIVHEGDIKPEDRLLVLEEPYDAIEKARELLSFA